MRIMINPEALLCDAEVINQSIRDPELSLEEKRQKILMRINQMPEYWDGAAAKAYQELAPGFVNSIAFSQKSDDELEQMLVQPLRTVAQSFASY